ncbi:MAG: hypothetical protein IBX55_15260 [Methyloprofundus sp.]|nr:hypothetical protein [Methyloprofundus sp.]
MRISVALLAGLALFGSCVNAKEDEENKALDFSLHWTMKQYAPVIIQHRKDKTLDIRGLFESKEEESSIDLDAHFERPHKENNDTEVTPDGLGVGIKLGI